MESRAKDDDVKSLGSVFNRNKDADTIKEGEEEEDVIEVDPNTKNSFDPNILAKAAISNQQQDDKSLGMSTAAKTTGTTRLEFKKLKELNAKLQAENQGLQQTFRDDTSKISEFTTKTTKNKLQATQDELVALKLQMAELQKLSQHKEIKVARASEIEGPPDIGMPNVGRHN